MAQKTKSEFVEIGDIIIKYSHYWKWFLLSMACMVVLAVFYLKVANPVYYIESNVKLKSEEEGSKVASSLVKSFGLGGLGGTENVDDQATIIASQTHMRDMIYSLGLEASYDLKKFPFDKSLYKNTPIVLTADRNVLDTLSYFIKFRVSVKPDRSVKIKAKYKGDVVGEYNGTLPAHMDVMGATYSLAYTAKPMAEGAYKMDMEIAGLDYAAQMFREKILVGTIDKKSNIISLNIKDTDRQRGKDILNKLVDLYNEDTKQDKNKEAENTAHFIQERISLLAQELGDIEKQLENFKVNNGLTDIESESKAFIAKYQDLQEKNTEIAIQQNITDLLGNYVSDSKNKYALIPLNTSIPGGAAEAVRAYNAAVLERSKLLQHSKEGNPVIQSLNKQIEGLRENVQMSVRNTQKDIAIRKKDWAGLEGEMKSRMSEMPRQEREFVELERQRQVKSELYVFLLTKMEETQLTLASTTPRAQVMDAAYNSWKPVSPRKKTVLVIAVILGIILPVIILYIIDIFKVKIQSKEELQEATDLPILGEICLDKKAGNIAVADGITSSTAELFRLVRTNLQFLLKKDEKVILVTSSISGEGKSFFTVNLALSFSLIKDKKVVLVGLDIRNPKLSEYLSIKRKDGMTLFLASDSMNPEEIIIPRPDLHPNIYVVPAGPIPPNPSELLLSDRLDEFFDYLRQNFDYIIVDTAPVGMISDTFALNRVADSTVYLFRANYTNKSYLKFAESIVEENKLKKLGLVINGTTTKAAYGYGYGQHHQASDKTKK